MLEVLVAFVILAMVLGVLMQVFSGGLRNVHRADEYQRAVLLAQSKLSTVGIELPLETGVRQGAFDDTYSWRVSVSDYPLELSEGDQQDNVLTPTAAVAMLQVEVNVFWGDPDKPRQVNLKTLRIVSEAVL